MADYFVIRASTDANQKSWILGEIKAGNLRQGWFAHRKTSLLTKNGALKSKAAWVQTFLTIVRAWVPNATTKRERKYLTRVFAQQKFEELKRLLDIREGDLLIV